MIGTRSIGPFDSLDAINASYLEATEELASALTADHLSGEGAAHFGAAESSVTRQLLATSPYTDNATVWEEGRQSWKPPQRPDPLVYKPFLVGDSGPGGSSPGDAGPGDTTLSGNLTLLSWRAGEQASISDELVLLCGLVFRLKPLALNWAHNTVVGDPAQQRRQSGAEHERLLGLLDPAWGQPLGRHAVVAPGPFHHVDSWEALLRERTALLSALSALTSSEIEDRHRYTVDRAEFENRRTTKKDHVVGAFDRRGWQFPVEWIGDRGEPFGHGLTADEILWNMLSRSVLRVATPAERDGLLGQLVPAWAHGPTTRGPQLPLR